MQLSAGVISAHYLGNVVKLASVLIVLLCMK